MSVLQTTLLTAVTMLAFAANSLLCRMALGAQSIDAGSFAVLRVTAGALVLVPLALWGGQWRSGLAASSWGSAIALTSYMVAFAWAYRSLDTGTGALLLFGAVQVSMIGWGLYRGERPRVGEWIGLAVAVGGLLVLLLPGAAAPDWRGSLLMLAAGVGWGAYSLRGRGSGPALGMTAGNFVLAVPLCLLALGLALQELHLEARGALWAVLSGGLTSALGYALWYRALAGHTASSAAVVQLSVPVLAALAGVAVLDETLSGRLLGASALTLGGVALAVWARARAR